MKTISKSILSTIAVVSTFGASMTPVLVNAWGDSANGRPSYTISEINSGALGDTITFNSIKDGKIGDEKNFVGARLSGETGIWNADTIKVEDGKTYTIRLYVHNNSPKAKARTAENVKASFSLPTTVSTEQTIIGYLDSSNATPTRYWDEVTLKSDQDFYLEYLAGTAKYTNANGVFTLADSLVSKDGAVMLGETELNGKIPGCFEYDGVVTIEVKVHNSVNAKVSKTVRKKGDKNWTESVNANVGDEVEFQIEYVNLLDKDVENVMIRDILPTNLEYVADSTRLYNAKYQSGVEIKDNTVTTSGINIGGYAPKGNAHVRFTAKVVDKNLACGDNQLSNWASSTVNSKVVKDDAAVLVKKTGGTCDTKPTPTPTPEPTPGKIVDTGAGEIVVSALGAGAVVTTAGFYIASRKKLM